MTTPEARELEPMDKEEASVPTEETRPGPVYAPAVDIFESDKELTILADMPGVRAEDLDLDLREGFLTLRAEVASPERPNERPVLRECRRGMYLRRFTLTENIDQARIDATIKNGVLKLVLPKVERAVPRRVTVKAA